jgi:hypothetical protein
MVPASIGIWVYLIPGWEIVTMPTATVTTAELVLVPVVSNEDRSWDAMKQLFR